MSARPTACFELLSAHHAAIATAVAQVVMMLAELGVYMALESRGFFLTTTLFRSVLFSVAAIYVVGAVAAVVGVLRKSAMLITVQITLTSTLMLFTDVLAISIIALMAIGKRNEFLNTLPGQFVNENKFYSVLGPFWMYLGAIILHITVAINMAFLQPYNDFNEVLQKESEVAKTALRCFADTS